MTFALDRILPTKIELVTIAVLAGLGVVLGNSGQFIAYYGLTSSTDFIQANASSALNRSLTKLDTFNFTRSAVTFAIWGAVGALTFSIFRGIARVYQTIEYEEEVSSKHYIHPSTFTRSKFWSEVAIEFLGLLGCLLLIALTFYGLVVFILPVALTYTRVFLLNLSVGLAGYFVLGLLSLFFGLTIFYMSIKFLVNRHRLFRP